MLAALDKYWESIESWKDEYRESETDQLQVLLRDNTEILAWLEAHPDATREEYVAWLTIWNQHGLGFEWYNGLIRKFDQTARQNIVNRADKAVRAATAILMERGLL